MKRFALTLLLSSLPAAAAEEVHAATPVVTEEAVFRSDRGCESGKSEALPTGPVAAPYHEADVATGRRACPRTEVGMGGHGGIILDAPNFYGGIEAAGTVFGSYAFDEDTEIFGTLEAYRYHYVVEATIDTTNVSLGQLTVGATHIITRRGEMIFAPSARLMLPTSFASPTRVVGAEVGLAYNQRLHERIELHGYFGLDGSLGLGAAAAYPRGGALLNFGAQLNAASFFGVALDMNGHFLRRESIDYLAPAIALRFRFGRVGAELGVSKPLAGADRHFVTGVLRVGYRF